MCDDNNIIYKKSKIDILLQKLILILSNKDYDLKKCESIINTLNICKIDDDYIKSQLKIIDIDIILNICQNSYNHIKINNILIKIIKDYIDSLDLKEKLNFIIKNNIYYDNNKLYNIEYKEFENTLLECLIYLIDNNKLYEKHVIFDFNIILNNIVYDIYIKYFCAISKYNKYIDSFKTLIKENAKFTSIYIYHNIKNKLFFDYIYETYENNIGDILDNFSSLQLLSLIKSDIFKVEIINRCINNIQHFDIDYIFIINDLINDNKISESLIRKYILYIYNINIYEYNNMSNFIILYDKHKYFNINLDCIEKYYNIITLIKEFNIYSKMICG